MTAEYRLALASGNDQKLNTRSRSKELYESETMNKAPCLKANASSSNGALQSFTLHLN
jgi:hypothetical protein